MRTGQETSGATHPSPWKHRLTIGSIAVTFGCLGVATVLSFQAFRRGLAELDSVDIFFVPEGSLLLLSGEAAVAKAS